MVLLFWVCLTLILSHYFLFPLFVFALSFLVKRPYQKGPIQPSVSFIIAAYNEEAVIGAKLKNVLALEYPKEKLEVIVVSDGSNDRTPEIVEAHSQYGIQGLFEAPRRGKTHALNRAVHMAQGEVLLFSDANTFYRKDAIQKLVQNFQDSTIGAVSGCKRILETSGRESSLGDRVYWAIESQLKRRESLLGSIPTADGEIFALRKKLYVPPSAETINDDMALTLSVVNAGYRVVYEPEAISEEVASLTLEDDFKVKARMVAGGYQIFSQFRASLFPPTLFTFQLLIHKGLRYCMPLLLIGLFLSNLSSFGAPFYTEFLGLQTLFYGMAILGAGLRKLGRPLGILYLPLYYCAMNAAALLGLFYFLRKKSPAMIWNKAVR